MAKEHIALLSLLVILIIEVNFCMCGLKEIKDFLKKYNKEGDELQRNDTLASWEYEIDMTAKSKEETVKWSAITSKFATDNRKKAKALLKDVDDDIPKSMIRQLVLIKRTASSTNEDENKESADLQSKMTSIYSKTVIKKEIDNDTYRFNLNHHLLPIMSEVSKSNLGNLRWAFRVWREAVGTKIRPLYQRFVELSNNGAQENGYEDYGDYWREEYEDKNLEQNMEDILDEMNQLYKKLHAYARFKLNEEFGDDVVGKSGRIPIHLLNMWGQNWSHLYKMFVPYANKTIPDVTSEMRNKKWKNIDLLKLSESFFVSIGLDKMPESFFEKSLYEKENGKKPVCHPSSWDLGQGDVRLKMPCMGVSQGDLITVHHEMGHIEYYLMYKDQPVEFRTGANPGFHEAVGDTITLSVMIPEHLETIGLLQNAAGDEASMYNSSMDQPDLTNNIQAAPEPTKDEGESGVNDSDERPEEGVNFLMKQALQKVAFIPFAYIIDKWRWSVFAGKIKPKEYNSYWWQLRNKYQGVTIPKGMKRNDEELCDPASFFHVAHNTEYLRYFLSHILQFQFHKALCDEAGVKGPYHKCSIHKSKKAGKKLRRMLELGKSVPWKEALEELTGSPKLSAKPILDYFKPLADYLDKHRDKNGYSLGWDD